MPGRTMYILLLFVLTGSATATVAAAPAAAAAMATATASASGGGEGGRSKSSSSVEDQNRSGTILRRVLATKGVLTAADQQQLLDKHNEGRSNTALGKTPGQPAATNMRQLEWDDELARLSTTWAETCTWAHDPNNTDGENLMTRWSTVNDNDNIAVLISAVEDWYEEYVDYNFATNSCDPFPAQCGHYTQNVWATTTHVGCGYANCVSSNTNYPFQVIFVCRYSPPGNWVGQQPYEAASAAHRIASVCPSEGYVAHFSNGLCVVKTEVTTVSPTTNTPTTSPTVAPTKVRPPKLCTNNKFCSKFLRVKKKRGKKCRKKKKVAGGSKKKVRDLCPTICKKYLCTCNDREKPFTIGGKQYHCATLKPKSNKCRKKDDSFGFKVWRLCPNKCNKTTQCLQNTGIQL